MPVPKPILANMKKQLDTAKEQLTDLEATMTNMRKHGINAADEEAKVKQLRADIRQLEGFYNSESARQ